MLAHCVRAANPPAASLTEPYRITRPDAGTMLVAPIALAIAPRARSQSRTRTEARTGGSGFDPRDKVPVKNVRDIYIPDQHVKTPNVKARNFRCLRRSGRTRESCACHAGGNRSLSCINCITNSTSLRGSGKTKASFRPFELFKEVPAASAFPSSLIQSRSWIFSVRVIVNLQPSRSHMGEGGSKVWRC
jgi:hypothetical protein